MFRADFRKETRYQRREVLTSPYGRKPAKLVKASVPCPMAFDNNKADAKSRFQAPKSEAPQSFWNIIKSWSFFTPPLDSDISSSDEEVEANEDTAKPDPLPLPSKDSDKTQSESSDNSNSGNEGAATSGGSSNSSPSASSSRRALHPIKPIIEALQPRPIAPPPAPSAAPLVIHRKRPQRVPPVRPDPKPRKKTPAPPRAKPTFGLRESSEETEIPPAEPVVVERENTEMAAPADPVVIEREHVQVTPVGPSPSSPPTGSGSNAEQESVQLQIVKFLRSKNGAPLTREEYEQISAILAPMVSSSAPEGDISILEAVMPKEADLDDEAKATLEKAADALQPADPAESVAASDKPSTGKEAEDDDDEDYSNVIPSPTMSSYGLPRYPEGGDYHAQTDQTESTDETSTEDEEARFEAEMASRTERIRRILHLDNLDYRDYQGWEELFRYKDVPRKHWTAEMLEAEALYAGMHPVPRPEAEPEIVEIVDVEMHHDDSRIMESQIHSSEQVKETKPQRDFTKGYTPVQAMVNPYDRIAAFARRRKQPHRIPDRPKQPSFEPMEMESEPADDTEIRLPLPEPPKEVLGEIRVLRPPNLSLAADYETDPTAAEPPRPSGKTYDGRSYTSMRKRKAKTLLLGVEDEEAGGMRVLDGPIEVLGPRPSKRRKSGEHPEPDDDLFAPDIVDLNLQNAHVFDEFEDHTPNRAETPPPTSKEKPKEEKQKWRPKLKRSKSGKGIAQRDVRNPWRRIRTNNFSHLPIIPSPLRKGAKTKSRRLLSKKLLHNATPRERADAIGDGLPSYEFGSSSSRMGSIGPIRASRDMIKVKREVHSLKPYALPEYHRVFKTSNRTSMSDRSASPPDADVAAMFLTPKSPPPPKSPKVNGVHVNGVHTNGVHTNGVHTNGVQVNGAHTNGVKVNGHTNGIHTNGVYTNGVHTNGVHTNGIHTNGIHTNGVHTNGFHVNGYHSSGEKENKDPVPAVEEPVDAFEIKNITIDEHGGFRKGKEYYALQNKPIVKLAIPPPVRKLASGPTAEARQQDWAKAGLSFLSQPNKKWTCQMCFIGHPANAMSCRTCGKPRVQAALF